MSLQTTEPCRSRGPVGVSALGILPLAIRAGAD